MTAEVVAFPRKRIVRRRIDDPMKAARWRDVVVVGITEDGEFHATSSDVTAERALWLLQWGCHWAMHDS